ncbi:MAG: IPT/TIG domain-containing protein [Burkholderiales bacterium]
MAPSSATAGGAEFTLNANGTNFVNGSTVRWNGANRPTTFISATQLTATIPATDIATAGTASVTVTAPDGIVSNAIAFTISGADNPAPTLTSISPTSATAGGATFTLTVTGSNFVSSSVVRWNGANRTTTFVSATQMSASIPAADIAAAGTAQVTVFTPTPGGGTSAAQTFTIKRRKPAAPI